MGFWYQGEKTHRHKGVLDLSVLSQSEYQAFIINTEEKRKLGNKTVRVIDKNQVATLKSAPCKVS